MSAKLHFHAASLNNNFELMFMCDMMVKNLSTMQETWVWSLGWEDLQKNGMATHSSILAWRIPLNRGAWRATVHGVQESDTTERLTHLCVMYIVAWSSIWIWIISSRFSTFLFEGLWKWCRGLLCAFYQEAHVVGMSVPWLVTWAVITWGDLPISVVKISNFPLCN